MRDKTAGDVVCGHLLPVIRARGKKTATRHIFLRREIEQKRRQMVAFFFSLH